MKRKLLVGLFGVLMVTCCFSQQVATGTAHGVFYSFPVMSATGQTPWIALHGVIPSNHALQVNTTGSPAACTYNLEGSLDGVNATSIIATQACTTSGTTTWATGKPVLFVRVNFTALSASSTATAIYAGSR